MLLPESVQQFRCVMGSGAERFAPREGFSRCEASLVGFDAGHRGLIDAEFSGQGSLGYFRIRSHLEERAGESAVEVAFRCERWGHAATLLRVSRSLSRYACAYVETA